MGLFGGLLDGLLEKALEEALDRFGYTDEQLADWLGYLRQDAPHLFTPEGDLVRVRKADLNAFARAAMMAAWNTLQHGSLPEEND